VALAVCRPLGSTEKAWLKRIVETIGALATFENRQEAVDGSSRARRLCRRCQTFAFYGAIPREPDWANHDWGRSCNETNFSEWAWMTCGDCISRSRRCWARNWKQKESCWTSASSGWAKSYLARSHRCAENGGPIRRFYRNSAIPINLRKPGQAV